MRYPFTHKIPKTIPEEMQAVVRRLKKTKSKEACLRMASEVLVRKYRGCLLYTYLNFLDLFAEVPKLWEKTGCLHCTNFGYLLRILLVKSGWFRQEDITDKWTLIWYISPHHYVEVKLGRNKKKDIDLWSKVYGVRYGKHAHGFR